MSTKPESVYGLTKRIDEELIEWLTLTKKLSACILRYFNPIGNHPSGHIWENPTQQPQNIMPIIMEVLEKKRESLSIFGNTYNTPDWTCIRDYIHVMDLAEAHVKAVERLLIENWKSIIKNLWVYEIINLWTGRGTSVIEMVTAVQESLWVSLPYTIVDARIWDLPTVYGDCSKAKQLLWRETKRSIAEGIRDTWKFRQKNAF
jgi:UDP-glucose 4-epimerase